MTDLQHIELLSLIEKIDNDTAIKGDYVRYNRVLNDCGLSNDDIKAHLEMFGLESIIGFYYLRNYGWNRNTEGSMLGTVLGLGYHVILKSKINKRYGANNEA